VEPFGTIVIVIAVVGALLAAFSFAGSGQIYRGLGRTGLALDEPELRPSPNPGSAAYEAEADAELRQLLEAKSARREARGQPPLDVEAELAQLAHPAPVADPALRDEVRDLVIASNERRARRGESPLDVEVEVERRLRDLGA
jgi:hypothetical protein